MDVKLTVQDEVSQVRLAGELDTYTVPQVRAAFGQLVAAPGTQVVVDLQDVTFIDSSGLGALIGLHNRLTAADARLQLVCGGVTLRLIKLAHLDQVIDVVEQLDARSSSTSATEPSTPA